MTHDSYKTWLDEMPIDDVLMRIERLERKLADLQVLERLYADHHTGDESVSEEVHPVEGESQPHGEGEAGEEPHEHGEG
jgi:hypothetical protein